MIFLISVNRNNSIGISHEVEYLGEQTTIFNRYKDNFLFELWVYRFLWTAKIEIHETFCNKYKKAPLVITAKFIDYIEDNVEITKHYFNMDEHGLYENWNWDGIYEKKSLAKISCVHSYDSMI